MPERDIRIESKFPNVGKNYRLTSPIDRNYNCIAHAVGDKERFWWPINGYWPENIPRNERLDTFIEAFKSLGYEKCGLDESFMKNFHKIAIYASEDGNATHAARQVKVDGKVVWTSKLGQYKDITHELFDLEGTEYGKVKVIMKKKMSFMNKVKFYKV